MTPPATPDTSDSGLPAPGGPTVGSFRFWFATQRWEWSPEVYRIHGYAPREIEPTTELMLAHKHPDDRGYVGDTIARCIEYGEPFSSRHRLIDTTGAEHTVMVVADRILDDRDRPAGTAGFYIDLGGMLAETEQDVLDTALPQLVADRAIVEQATGMLMWVYRISAEQALKILTWRSDETGTPLRLFAARLIADLSQEPPLPASTTAAVDHLLLTLHHRAPAEKPH
ncbi:PAS and ANTAR domain-containing protein [Nocardia pseudobrasiliensis]|uniref:ANTAR domain-containing protein n=1 Tax=Nocardia pseudobrasiliensis TaxID=45979 RepID=A0A370I4B7_9NOCA|nr:PAS and ANTAR domain-containing protein [Nocardia pseudobrasiliensis]RDI65593.1 ANTAR domain-containing protein [Nocardia pseudobrasiliensis]